MDRKQVQRLLFDLNGVIGMISDHYERKLPTAIQATMKDLRRSTDLLKDAWSEMVWRNLMTDIVRNLERLKLAFGPVPQLNQPGLANVCSKSAQLVKKVLATHDPTKSKYKSVVCLGYRVKRAASNIPASWTTGPT